MPDEELNFISTNMRKQLNEDQPHLTTLLYESQYNIDYNEYKFQKHGKDIKTCGRHAAMRLVFRHLSLDDYKQLLDFLCKILKMNYDEIVTLLTGYINKNIHN